jgi:methyl-accepting chemotaxis protein
LYESLKKIDTSVSEVAKFSQEIGNATAEQSAGAQQIEQSTAKLSDLTQEISAATEEQSSASKQVVRDVETMMRTVQQKAGSAAELTASAEELSRQSGLMRQWISHFQLNDNGDGAVRVSGDPTPATDPEPFHASLLERSGRSRVQ